MLAMVCCLSSVAMAQSSEQQQACEDHSDMDLVIRGCTALIDAGHESREHLAVVYNNRGYAWSRKGDATRAIADYDQAIRLDPQSILALNNRGDAYSGQGHYDKAIADFDRVLWIDPDYGPALNNRCWVRAL